MRESSYNRCSPIVSPALHIVASLLRIADRRRAPCRTNLNLNDSGSGPLHFLNDLWGRFSYQYYSATLCCEPCQQLHSLAPEPLNCQRF